MVDLEQTPEPVEVELVDDVIYKKIEEHLKSTKFEVSNVTIEKGSIKGDNYLGVIAKMDIQGKTKDGENKTLHWIVKSAPKNETYREMINVETSFHREYYMYSEVFPVFMNLQLEKHVPRPFKNFIPLHLGYMDAPHECIVMENMKELGYVMKDRFHPLDLEHTKRVMRNYGKYHALSIGLAHNKPEVFKKIAENTQENFFSKWVDKEMMIDSIKLNLQAVIDLMNPDVDQAAIQKLEKLKPVVLSDMVRAFNPEIAGNYSVICHGDCWLNNMLFKYDDESNVPTEVLCIDYQLSRVGSPALDLSYFLFTCTDKEVRKHMKYLFDEYHDSMSSMLIDLGCDPKVAFPREEIDKQFSQASIFGFVAAIMVLFLMNTESEDVPDWSKMDLDELKGSIKPTTIKQKNQDNFNKRMRDLVLDCINNGFILKN